MSNRPFSNKSNSNNILLVEKMHNVVKYEEKLESIVGSHFMSGADPDPELISYESYKKGLP
ncbi:MAG: hypothetical protein QNJ54_26755 [Prochloraceae cyanobacterium]|nr:hypothetical protein [Prochloraceae cyanobacterium]